jgi:DHA1 family tetracycline resistance protein-like MFS transporter
MNEPRRSRSTLRVLFGVVIVDLIGFGIVVPVLPFYADRYGANGTVLGVIIAAYAAAQFVCAPLWGRLSDRIGRRPVMLMTIAGTALSLLFLGLADSVLTIFLARLLGGAFAANVSVASAYVSDVTAAEERTRWMGMLGASFGVGFVLGPAIGGVLAPYGYHVPMLTAAGLAALNWVHAGVSLREPPVHAATAAPPAGLAPGRFTELRDPLVRRLCTSNLIFALGVAQLETMFPYFMKDAFGWDAREVAFVLVGMAVVMGGIQGGGMKALSARFSERALVVTGCAILALGFLAVPEAPSIAILLLPLTACAVGRAVAQPALMSLASLAGPADRRGSVMGAFQSSASLARVIGPLAAGWLYDQHRGWPFLLAAALLLAVAVLGRTLPERLAGAAPAPLGEAGLF